MADTWTPTPKPSPGTSSEITYRALLAQYGDGYEQRVADGIQTRRIVTTLEWPVLSVAEAATLFTFIDAHPAWVAFNYTLPWEGSARLWRITKVSRRETGPVRVSLTVEITEALDP